MATNTLQWDAKSFDLFSSNQPTLLLENGTTIPISGYSFTANAQVMYRRFNATAYLSGNLTARIRWYSQTGQVTGNVRWDAAIAAITPGDAQSVLTKALATATNTTTTVSGTARAINTTDVTISNLDSLAADDEVWLAITRGAATMTGGAVIVDVQLVYAATGGVGAGNVSNAGASTDNAAVRFDLATGQVVQNSGVIIDDSNNVTGNRFIGPATGLRETTGPTDLTMGSVLDGDSLERSGTTIIGKFTGVCERSTSFSINNTALIDVTNMTFALPRAGTYHFSFAVSTTKDATASVLGWAVNFSGTTTRIMVNGVFWQAGTTGNTATANAVNTAILETSATAETRMPKTINGSITVSTSGTLTLRAQRSSTSVVTMDAGSSGMCIEL